MEPPTPDTHLKTGNDSPAHIDKDEPCQCHRPSWAELVDLALEVQCSRELLVNHGARQDLVELIASRCALAYEALGGTRVSLSAWRARARRMLEESRAHG